MRRSAAPILVLGGMAVLPGCDRNMSVDGPDAHVEENLASATPDAQHIVGATTGEQWLILEFPDGVRGGRGNIQGSADQLPEFGLDMLMRRIRACGAREPRLDRSWSHSLHIVSRSSPHDREVVRCVQRSVPHHFSAGVGTNDPKEYFRKDQRPFREFATPPDEPIDKAD